ncbi:glycosyltransferase [Dyadobacter arcticus]|uniref:Cellulose synthase/poly-beta-1,6-N-acetylglucosamine synthase-like glycosyltransferase n=1 Tax=Dyadobacter arcticus TaxID=1078754 RepID=A0ABX0UQ23_9BACT|nr:glycosyltransferase [Dyadobacter arcticus]NIJ55098.1 cellulose synthase/poly-beta-1,6-N-acetylglucosamine synthase-like glycosyltransferase [Dyadobacter arcticus]
MIALIWIFIASYAVFTITITFFWKGIKPASVARDISSVRISVIIPVRNEAENIGVLLEDLASQLLPANQFEVLVMDDSSSDDTALIVSGFASKTSCDIRVISLPNIPTTSPKKRAIETAVMQAKGNLIVTTDGDCRVGPGWLLSIANYYAETGAKLISAPVTFLKENTLAHHLQTVEFASLIGSGASAIAAGYPSLCNGANLTYEKQVFLDVNGFEGVKHIASGDDEFLMHKVAARYPDGVHFLKDPEAIVATKAHTSWKAFFRQRKRWASKWKHYQSKTPLILAVYIFLCNFSLVVGCFLWLAGAVTGQEYLAIVAVKCIPEWFFLGSILNFLRKPGSIFYIPITQIIYPFYVCFFGLVSQRPEYEWKGRKLV